MPDCVFPVADRGSIVRRAALIQLPHGVLYLCYIPLCLWKSPSFSSFAILTAICLMQAASIALYTVCEYKLPYFLFDPKDYGTVLATSGVVCAVISLGAGTVIARLSEIMDYSVLMLWSCVVAFGLMIISAALCAFQKTVFLSGSPAVPGKKTERKHGMSILRHPAFYRMIPANLFRGFAVVLPL